MGTIVDITDDFKADFLLAVTEFFDYRSTPCVLNYPPIVTPCSSCGTNYYDNGTEFNSLSDCSACGGVGNFTTVNSETINLVIYADPAEWKKLGLSKVMDVRIPDGSILVRGKIADLIKMRQCENINIDTVMAGLQGGAYELYGEPVDKNRLLRGNFFWAFLARAEVP